MATREVYISLKGDNSDAKRKVAEIEARLKGIEKNAIKLKLDINDKQLKDTISSASKLKDIKLTTNADQITSQFQRLGTVTTRFNEQLAKGAKSSTLLGTQNQIDSTIARIQKLNSQQVGDLFKNASSSIGTLRSGIDGISASLGGILAKGAVVGAVLSGGLLAGFKGALEGAKNFELSRASLQAMVGSADIARAKIAEIQKLAASTPFEFPDLLSSVKQLVSYGFTADDAIASTKRLGDVAAGANIPMADMAYLFGTLKTQGKARTQDINQFSQRGIPIIGVLAKQFGVAEDQILSMAENSQISFKDIEKAFQTMTSEGGIFNNQMKIQSNTLQGLQSTFKDLKTTALNSLIGISEGGDVIEGSIFDLSKKLLDGIINNPKVAPALDKFSKAFASSLKGIFGNIDAAGFGDKIVGFLDKASQKIPGIINTIVSNFKRIKSEITPILKTAGAVIAGFLEKVGGGDKVQGAIKTVEGLVKAFIGLKAISPILGGLQSSLGILGTLKKGGSLGGVLGFVQGFAKVGTSGLSGLASGFSGLAAAIAPALPIIAGVAAALLLLFGVIGKGDVKLGFIESVKKAMETLKEFASFLKGLFSGPIAAMKPLFKGIADSFSILADSIRPLLNWLNDLAKKLGFSNSAALGLALAFTPLIIGLAAAAAAFAVFLLAVKVVVDILTVAVASIKAAGKGIKAFWDLLKSGNTKKFGSDMSAINDEFNGSMDKIANSYKTTFSGVKSAFTGVKTEANNTKFAIDGIKSSIDSLGNASLNVERLKAQLQEITKQKDDALATAGGNIQDPAYRQALISEIELKNQLKDAEAQLNAEVLKTNDQYNAFISKSKESAGVTQAEKDAILGSLQSYRDQQAQLGLNTAELDKMIQNIITINATPADVKTTTNAPETIKQQDNILLKQGEINGKESIAKISANDEATPKIDGVYNKLLQITRTSWNTNLDVNTNFNGGTSMTAATGGIVPQYRKTGGLIYANKGYAHPGNPRGSDVVPAWLTPGEGVIRRSSMASIGKDMFNSINKYGNKALQGIFNQGFKAGNSYTNNKTANTTVNITNNNPGAAISTMLGLNNRINGAFA